MGNSPRYTMRDPKMALPVRPTERSRCKQGAWTLRLGFGPPAERQLFLRVQPMAHRTRAEGGGEGVHGDLEARGANPVRVVAAEDPSVVLLAEHPQPIGRRHHRGILEGPLARRVEGRLQDSPAA